MEIIRLVVGELEENCYIICKNGNALIVDPGDNSSLIINTIKNNNLNVLGILITHYHFDHIGALDDVKNTFKVDVYDYKSKSDVKLDCFNFSIIKNYGHTLDSVRFYFEEDDVCFTGDFVFKESIGNFDYDNENIMYDSLVEFKKSSKESTVIYPGHGDKTNVKHELLYNYFIRSI